MSHSDPKPTPMVQEKTFTSYTEDQGKAYAQVRRDYHPSVYKTIIEHHTSTGGRSDTILDVGCGPGLATRGFAPLFTHAIGLDPSEGMLTVARSLGGVTSTSEPLRYEISSAEELGQNLSPPIQESSIDLITAANAAHWFNMSAFWSSAARVLKPGGTVALWTSGEIRTDPSVPNAAAIQAALDEYGERDLKPYYEPGNLLARNRYVGIPLPWTLAEPILEFDESTFVRKDWDAAGQFFVGLPEGDLDVFEKTMATASALTRWRQAHPEDAETERDVLRILRRTIERLLHEAGVEKGHEKVKGTVHGSVLMVKKKV